MRKLLLGLIASLLIATTAAAHDTYQVSKYVIWFDACDYTPYSCIGVMPPQIEFKKLRPRLLGYYDGGDTIYVSNEIDGTLQREVILHEMIHYLQKMAGGLVVPGPAKEICEAEAETFAAVDQWLRDIGRDDMITGPNWWRPYKHCRRFYGNGNPWGNLGGGWL